MVVKARCSHPGGSEPCRYCRRRTCANCHHSEAHLSVCPETARRETGRGRRTTKAILPRPFDVAKQPGRRTQAVSQDLRDAVYARAGGCCELCGERLQPGWEWHHRKRRSQGGADHVSNGVALHGLCHKRVHGHVAWAESTGFLVRSTDNPGRKRLALHGTRWVRLTAQGTYEGAA
jgi:hypothetical protein